MLEKILFWETNYAPWALLLSLQQHICQVGMVLLSISIVRSLRWPNQFFSNLAYPRNFGLLQLKQRVTFATGLPIISKEIMPDEAIMGKKPNLDNP